jgi:glucose-6-phosphate-specific signal transduction histidine kinase
MRTRRVLGILALVESVVALYFAASSYVCAAVGGLDQMTPATPASAHATRMVSIALGTMALICAFALIWAGTALIVGKGTRLVRTAAFTVGGANLGAAAYAFHTFLQTRVWAPMGIGFADTDVVEWLLLAMLGLGVTIYAVVVAVRAPRHTVDLLRVGAEEPFGRGRSEGR